MINKENLYIAIARSLFSVFIGLMAGCIYSFYLILINFPVDTSNVAHAQTYVAKSTAEVITRIADEKGFDKTTAFRIIICESKLGRFKENFEGSSATGILQFMPSTFKSFCRGDINSDEDQIRCFMDLYPKYAGMWECK